MWEDVYCKGSCLEEIEDDSEQRTRIHIPQNGADDHKTIVSNLCFYTSDSLPATPPIFDVNKNLYEAKKIKLLGNNSWTYVSQDTPYTEDFLLAKILQALNQNILNSPLRGKTVYSFGDSLMAGHYSGKGILDTFAKQYGLIYTKYAQNGATIQSGDASISKQIPAEAIAPDFIIFDGLVNDALETATITNFETDFQNLITAFKTKYPLSKIIFVTPHKMPTRPADKLNSLVTKAIAKCVANGVSVVDIYNEGRIDTNNEEMKTRYSYNQTEGDGNGNGTHLTGVGYDIFYAPLIQQKMLELL